MKLKKKNKMKKIYLLTLFSIAVIICVLYIGSIALRTNTLSKKQKLNEDAFPCHKELSCKNCSVFISCLNIIGNDTGHNIYVKVKNQNTTQGNCFIQFELSDESKLLINKTYKIGMILPSEIKGFVVPYNDPTENTKFHVIPWCEW